MTRTDDRLLITCEELFAHAELLAHQPDALGGLAAVRQALDAFRGTLPVVDDARAVRKNARRQLQRAVRGLDSSVHALGWSLSHAKVGRVRAPFERVGGPTLRELRHATYDGEHALLRGGLAALEATQPPPSVRAAIEACRSRCAERESRWREFCAADHALRAARDAVALARRNWRMAFRALKRSCGGRGGYWPDATTAAARLFVYAEAMGSWTLESAWVNELNEGAAKYGWKLRDVPPRPVLAPPPVVAEPADAEVVTPPAAPAPRLVH